MASLIKANPMAVLSRQANQSQAMARFIKANGRLIKANGRFIKAGHF